MSSGEIVWWLRSPSSAYSLDSSYVFSYGVIYYSFSVHNAHTGVVPALRIKASDLE